MAIKKFKVRADMVYRDADGKVHAAGDTLDLPEEQGAALHQLELADPKAQAKAAAAEEAAAEAERLAQAEQEAAAEAERLANAGTV